jgi:nucleoside-diphosphate-sugar epimerase
MPTNGRCKGNPMAAHKKHPIEPAFSERWLALWRETAGELFPFYVTDAARVTEATGWSPKRSVSMILDEVVEWLDKERATLEPILA